VPTAWRSEKIKPVIYKLKNKIMTTKIKPAGYKSLLNETKTEEAVQFVKDTFSRKLSEKLNLQRVTAPLMLAKGTGINDDLNGTEKPVSFLIKDLGETRAEVIQSLAKWKRQKLASMSYEPGKGIYTNMHALRPDEILSSVHSVFVDQWDWEKVMHAEDRNETFLKETVKLIYTAIKETETELVKQFPELKSFLPDEIFFIHSEDLLLKYPVLTPKEREDEICGEKGAVFIIGIGAKLSNGIPHDLRAPDYDNWSVETSKGKKGLNGDVLVWNPVLQKAFEVSSMGIRVDKTFLVSQLEELELTERLQLSWHKSLVEGKLPQTIGGGIGQSRLSMLLTQKAHIGEVQPALWPDAMIKECKTANIDLL
jgi:aspartate--ammonia ligase